MSMSDDRRLPMAPSRPQGQPPIFEKIAIIGLGLIGGSISIAAKQTWPAGLVIAVDRKDVLEQAMVRHAIDVAADELYVISEADLVVLAAPVLQNVELLGQLEEVIAREAIVTDVGSTKRAIVNAARALPPRFTFVGGHPLGGAARGGFEFARADLFTGRPWIFTPHTDGAGAAMEKLFAFATALGAMPRTMSPEEHDRVLAFLSHLPQLAASALMDVVGGGAGESLALAGRGLVDTTRLASSPADIWRDIVATNADQIGPALDTLIERLTRLRADLTDGETLDGLFEEAAHWRDQLMQGRE